MKQWRRYPAAVALAVRWQRMLRPLRQWRHRRAWLLIGIAVAVVLGGAVYLRIISRDRLVRYVPADAMIYGHSRSALLAGQQGEPPVPLVNFWSGSADRFGLMDPSQLRQLAGGSDQIALWVQPTTEAHGTDWVLAFHLRNHSLDQLLVSGFQHWVLMDDEVLLVATSASALQRADQVATGQLVGLRVGASSWLSRNQVNLLINPEQFAATWPDQPLLQLLAASLGERLTVGFRRPDDAWRASIDAASFPIAPSAGDWLRQVPADFALASSGARPLRVLAALALGVNGAGQLVDQAAASWSQLGVGELAALAAALDQPGQLLLYPNSSSPFGADAILALPPLDQSTIAALERWLQLALAHLNPTAERRELPDGTSVTELRAGLDRWQWRTASSSLGTLHSLTAPESLPGEFAYVAGGEPVGFLVSNSAQRLGQLISQPEVDPSDVAEACHTSGELSGYAVIDPSQLLDAGSARLLLEGSELVLVVDDQGRISGCLVEK